MVYPKSEFSLYVDWAASQWTRCPPLSGEFDVAVMGLGLVGETGEVDLAVRQGGTPEGLMNLKLELGDALFYLCCIAKRFHIDLHLPQGTMRGNEPAAASLPDLYLLAARIAEALKKEIRDAPPECLTRSALMDLCPQYLARWLTFVASTPWSFSEVMAANRQKLERRGKPGMSR